MSGLQCDDCGKFMITEGASWALIYDLAGMCLDKEHWRCPACTERLGPAQSNARPHDGNMQSYQGVITLPARLTEGEVA